MTSIETAAELSSRSSRIESPSVSTSENEKGGAVTTDAWTLSSSAESFNRSSISAWGSSSSEISIGLPGWPRTGGRGMSATSMTSSWGGELTMWSISLLRRESICRRRPSNWAEKPRRYGLRSSGGRRTIHRLKTGYFVMDAYTLWK